LQNSELLYSYTIRWPLSYKQFLSEHFAENSMDHSVKPVVIFPIFERSAHYIGI